MRTLLLTLFLAKALFACKHFLYGELNSDKILCRESYAVGYNYKYKIPNFSVANLTLAKISKMYYRDNYYTEDRDIDREYRAKVIDYEKIGFIKAQLISDENLDFTKKAQIEAFLLSNIAPQYTSFYYNIWDPLQEYIRDLLKRRAKLHIIAGTVIKDNYKLLNSIVIPTEFYMIIYDPFKQKAITFLIPHTKKIANTRLNSYITTVQKIEMLTGLDFLKEVEFVINSTEMW
jgi:endonuclease G